jgi:hypothetical protein
MLDERKHTTEELVSICHMPNQFFFRALLHNPCEKLMDGLCALVSPSSCPTAAEPVKQSLYQRRRVKLMHLIQA